MPALSKDLPNLRQPNQCQRCKTDVDLDYWQEFDEHDQPQTPPVFVCLCLTCSNDLISLHPRLYDRVVRNAPIPGIMRLCWSCKHSADLSCTCPLLLRLGGPGMLITYSKPTTSFLDGRDAKGKRWGRVVTTYAAPPSSCAGYEPIYAVVAAEGEVAP